MLQNPLASKIYSVFSWLCHITFQAHRMLMWWEHTLTTKYMRLLSCSLHPSWIFPYHFWISESLILSQWSLCSIKTDIHTFFGAEPKVLIAMFCVFKSILWAKDFWDFPLYCPFLFFSLSCASQPLLFYLYSLLIYLQVSSNLHPGSSAFLVTLILLLFQT